MLEKEIQKVIIEYLTLLENKGEIYFFRANSFAGSFQRQDGSSGWIKNNKRGLPDIIICHDGKFVGMEVKTPKGRQSPYQKMAEKAIKECGGIYKIARSLDDAIEIIEEL